MPLAEDWDVFFNVNELASSATLNGATTVKVLAGAQYVDLLNIDGVKYAAIGRAADFPAATAPPGSSLLIGSTTYTIISRPQPYDDGVLVILPLAI